MKKNKKEIKDKKMTAKIKEDKINEKAKDEIIEVKKEEAEVVKKELEFKALNSEQIKQYKLRAGALGLFKYFLPNYGYFYFRNLDFGEMTLLTGIYVNGYATGSIEVSNDIKNISAELIQKTLIYPNTEAQKLRVVNILMFEDKLAGMEVMGLLGRKLVRSEPTEFEEL